MGELTLRPMSASEFETFYSKTIAEYARENVKAGSWPESDAMELSMKAMEQFLPQGKETPKVLLLSAENSHGKYVGYIWIGLERPGSAKPLAWLYDIEVAEEHRGKGYGRSLLQAAEEETLKNGIATLGLNVFGTNTVARKLYESDGYSVIQMTMSKQLGNDAGS